jgi:hypothetical protein
VHRQPPRPAAAPSIELEARDAVRGRCARRDGRQVARFCSLESLRWPRDHLDWECVLLWAGLSPLSGDAALRRRRATDDWRTGPCASASCGRGAGPHCPAQLPLPPPAPGSVDTDNPSMPMPRTTLLVTLGRRNGVMDLPFGKFRTGWLHARPKRITCSSPKNRKGIGLAPQPKSGDGAAPTETSRQNV